MSKYSQSPNRYNKRNYVEVVELLFPNTYIEEDYKLSGVTIDPVDQIINTHLNIANGITKYLDISAVAGSETSALNTYAGVSKYFVKQNKLTNITPYLLDKNILKPLGYKLTDYRSIAEFSSFCTSTLIPLIRMEPLVLEDSISTLSAYTGSTDASSVYNYLVDTLGWYFFLNTSSAGNLAYEPSSFVLSGFLDVYQGNTLETVDGIKGLTEYIWKNLETCSTFSDIPVDYLSGSTVAISGTQQLDKLKTMLDVIYSPLRLDESDFRVEDSFLDFEDAGVLQTNLISRGPFRKFSTALGYSLADQTETINGLGVLYNIDEVDQDYLPQLARIIGWELLGPKSDKWRQQLKTAVELYKAKGTKGALQTAINMVLSNNNLDLSGSVVEVWESYIPHLIWYALGTESTYFKSLSTWTHDLALEAGISNYDYTSLENNLKITVDHIMLDLYEAYPDLFSVGDTVFPVSRFYNLDAQGNETTFYTPVYSPNAKTFMFFPEDSYEYDKSRFDAKNNGKFGAWSASKAEGPLGFGVYLEGNEYTEDSNYLSHKGDTNFVFNYRNHDRFPIPPFEEYKYYDEWKLSKSLITYLANRLNCFGVPTSFTTDLVSYIEGATLTNDTNLQSLNGALMLFDAPQTAPNLDKVIANTSNYMVNLLDLWCGKSSHIFVDFASDDFDFTSTNLDSDGRYGLQNAAEVVRRFSPAHAIPQIAVNASSTDALSSSSIVFSYVGLDKDQDVGGYASGTIFGNGFGSGAKSRELGEGNTLGRGGMNAFKRYSDGTRVSNVSKNGTNEVGDNLISPAPTATRSDFFLDGVPRRSIRRRNLKAVLPLEGYYDRTGFNSPTSWDPSALENSTLSSLGELTLGYIPSSLKFATITDPVSPGGVWDKCETLQSSKTFYGVDTSNTFPYRGLSSLGSDYFGLSAHANYVDRGQLPLIYMLMHNALEEKARHEAESILGEPIYSYLNKGEITPLTQDVSSTLWDFGSTYVNKANGGAPTGAIEAVFVSSTAGGFADYGTLTVPILSGVDHQTLVTEVADDFYTGRTYINVGDGSTPLDRIVIVTVGLRNADEYFLGETLEVSCDIYNGSATSVATVNTDTNLDISELTYGSDSLTFQKVTDTNWYKVQVKLQRRAWANQMTINIKPGPETTDPITLNRTNHIWGMQVWKGADEDLYLLTDDQYASSNYWKDNIQSLANSAIASGLTLNSFEDYENFAFGRGLTQIYNDYVTFFGAHSLGGNTIDDTGFSILAHTFGRGLYNIDLQLDGSAATSQEGTYRSTNFSSILPISQGAGSGVFSLCAVDNGHASGTYVASSAGQTVIPYLGSFTSGAAFNAEFRNPHIISGIEFVDISGSPSGNSFFIYDIAQDSETIGDNSYYVNNPMIKCKSLGGLPRIRFDLSSYGPVRNKLKKDHKFRFDINALVGDESNPTLGGGLMGVWIHTEAKNGKLWSWSPKTVFNEVLPPAYGGPGDTATQEVGPNYLPNQDMDGKWVLVEESDISRDKVVNTLCFKHQFHQKAFTDIDTITSKKCIGINDTPLTEYLVNNARVKNFTSANFDTISIPFDTRNETHYNNSEYLEVIPVPDSYFKDSGLVHGDDTNYIIEIFMLPTNNSNKFLLLENFALTDVTLLSRAVVPTGYSISTGNSPLYRIVDQKSYSLTKPELREALKFFAGLGGYGNGTYKTVNASRNATTTSGVMDTSGGSRLSYRDTTIEDVTTSIIAGDFNTVTLGIKRVLVEN